MIEVVRPGPLATVQDLGRPGLGRLGVPHAGAADAASLRLANRLVGNPEGAAGLELTLGRAVFRFRADAWVAVAGAPAKITVRAEGGAEPGGRPGDGPQKAPGNGPQKTPGGDPRPAPGGDHKDTPVAVDQDVRHGSAFRVPPGGLVQVGAPSAGLRSYLAVRGGIDVPPVLGSRSADLRSGLGPGPLRPGDLLPVGQPGEPSGEPPTAPPGEPPPALVSPEAGQARVMPVAGEATEARVVPGPRDDWFVPGALDVLCGGDYVVTPASDRTGLRLDGPALPRARDDELPSEGVVTGALQVPPGGQPILLLADHPVTGGYPVIAVVAVADIGLAAQLRPGGRMRFVLGPDPLGEAPLSEPPRSEPPRSEPPLSREG